ncbi:DUF998 domain-containing protein [Thermoplasmatota archaeon]
MDKKLLYYGGIFGPIVFLLNDIIGGIVTPNYSYIEQPISDLTQAGSTYLLGSVLLFIAAILAFIFGIGIISHYKFKINKLIFLGGISLIIIALFNSLTGTILPQDPRNGTVITFAGTMHLALVGIVVILTFIALIMIGIGFNRQRQWKTFRNFSLISLLIMLIFGGVLTPYIIANNIELLGFVERVVAYVFQIWSVVIAYKLITEYYEEKIKN